MCKHPLSVVMAALVTLATGCVAQQGAGRSQRQQDVSPQMPVATGSMMNMMDQYMKRAQEMHQKMAAARTPEDRQKLTAENMKTMREGMVMMQQMMSGSMSMGSMDMGGQQPGQMQGGMMQQHQMMEKRMQMMQSMMQMMIDGMAQPMSH